MSNDQRAVWGLDPWLPVSIPCCAPSVAARCGSSPSSSSPRSSRRSSPTWGSGPRTRTAPRHRSQHRRTVPLRAGTWCLPGRPFRCREESGVQPRPGPRLRPPLPSALTTPAGPTRVLAGIAGLDPPWAGNVASMMRYPGVSRVPWNRFSRAERGAVGRSSPIPHNLTPGVRFCASLIRRVTTPFCRLETRPDRNPFTSE